MTFGVAFFQQYASPLQQLRDQICFNYRIFYWPGQWARNW